MRVLIIADDLTGALDSAVTLTGAGLRCVVARRPGDVRGGARGAARRPQRQHRLARGRAPRRRGRPSRRRSTPSATCRRSCSRRSTPASRAMSRTRSPSSPRAPGAARALVAPAIPAQGRTVVDGRLTGAGVAAPIDVAAVVAGERPRARGAGHPHRRRLRRRAGGARWTGRRRCSSAPPGWRPPSRAGWRRAPGRSRRRGCGRRSCSRSARTIRSPSRRSTGWPRAARATVTTAPDGVCPARWRAAGAARAARGGRGAAVRPARGRRALRRRDCATCQGGRGPDAARLRRRDGGRHPRRARAGRFDDRRRGLARRSGLQHSARRAPAATCHQVRRIRRRGCPRLGRRGGAGSRKVRDEGRDGSGRTGAGGDGAAREAGARRPGLPPALQPDLERRLSGEPEAAVREDARRRVRGVAADPARGAGAAARAGADPFAAGRRQLRARGHAPCRSASRGSRRSPTSSAATSSASASRRWRRGWRRRGGTRQALEEIATALSLMEGATDSQTHREDADFAFHLAVAKAANNQYFEASMRALREHIYVGMKLHGQSLMTDGAKALRRGLRRAFGDLRRDPRRRRRRGRAADARAPHPFARPAVRRRADRPQPRLTAVLPVRREFVGGARVNDDSFDAHIMHNPCTTHAPEPCVRAKR